MFILGLTGNIGCGKSTVAKVLEKKGFYRLDADEITKNIYNYRADKLYKKMYDAFGDIFDENKIVDKKKLGPIVFGDPKKLKLLNSIVHPIISELINQSLILAMETKRDKVILDAALLYEGGIDKIVDKVLVITCDKDIQFKRIKERDQLSDDEIKRRMNSQMDQAQKAKRADYLIDNSGSIEELEIKIEEFLSRLENNNILK